MYIIGAIILGWFLFMIVGIIWAKIESKSKEKEFKILIEDLKKNGFPNLTDEEQINLLSNADLDVIRQKLKIEEVPFEILNYVIILDEETLKKELKKELHNSNIVEKHNFKKAGKQDGDWIRKFQMDNRINYELIHQERGNIFDRQQFKDYDSLLDYLVVCRLTLVPKYQDKYYKDGVRLISQYKKLQ